MTEAELYTLYKGVYLPALVHSPQSLSYFEKFTFRPEDVVIVSYPKSGESVLPLILSLVICLVFPRSLILHNCWFLCRNIGIFVNSVH